MKFSTGDYLFDRDWTAEAKRSRNIAAIVAVNKLVRRQYLRGVPTFPSDRIVTIPNGVDDQRRTRPRHGPRRGVRSVSTMSSCSCASPGNACKRISSRWCLLSTKSLLHPEAHLLIAGTGRGADLLPPRSARGMGDGSPLATASTFATIPPIRRWCCPPPTASCSTRFLRVGPLAFNGGASCGGARHCQRCRRHARAAGNRPVPGVPHTKPLWRPARGELGRRSASVCYARQANREELVEAMCALVRDREKRAAGRERARRRVRGALSPLIACVPTPTFSVLASPATSLVRIRSGDDLACARA